MISKEVLVAFSLYCTVLLAVAVDDDAFAIFVTCMSTRLNILSFIWMLDLDSSLLRTAAGGGCYTTVATFVFLPVC